MPGFDRYIFLPIVRVYEFVTPVFVQNRVSDFFANIQEIPTFANNVLQLKGDAAGRSATRFIINTMFTAGLFDLAGAKGICRGCRRISARRSATGAQAQAPSW